MSWTTADESTVKFINKREPDTEVINQAEEDRLQRRHNIREQLGQAHLAKLRLDELNRGIRQVGFTLDALAATHEQETSALQTELQAVERRLVEALAARKPTASEDEERRRQLLRDLDAANGKLQAALEETRKVRPRLEREINESDLARIASGTITLVNDLQSAKNANRDLYVKWRGHSKAAELLSGVISAASEQAEGIRDMIRHNNEQAGNGHNTSREDEYNRLQLDVIEAALNHVSRFSAEMRGRAESARLEVIDE